MEVAPYFKGKNYWAIILGGSSGLGLASARKLASEGMNIFILHRDRRKDLPSFEKEMEWMESQGVLCLNYNGDATNPVKMQEALDEFERALSEKDKVRTLLHSISRGNLKSLKGEDGLTKQDLQFTIDAMALCWFDWVKALHERSLFAHDARALAFTSEGNERAWSGYAAVSAAKVTLESLCRSMAQEYAEEGIRCNVIQAGMTDTASFRMIPGHEKLAETAKQRNPFDRLTTPEDVAGMVYLLSRGEAAWVNGALIPVDGGEKNS
jgi:enoyl-[acyl-carrier protein] reductase I